MKKKLTAILLAVCLLGSALIFATACGSNEEFKFTGAATINDVEYNVTVTGNKDDEKSFTLAVAELPGNIIKGNYEIVEGKGYRLTFLDSKRTEVKVKYAQAEKEFYFTYSLDLGTVLGAGEVKFTYKNENFILDTTPDEIWDFEPFSFTGGLNQVMGVDATLDVTVSCEEGGKFKGVGKCNLSAVKDFTGTYTYDKTANAYTFVFDTESEKFPYPDKKVTTTYDEATKTYSFECPVTVVLAEAYVPFMNVPVAYTAA